MAKTPAKNVRNLETRVLRYEMALGILKDRLTEPEGPTEHDRKAARRANVEIINRALEGKP